MNISTKTVTKIEFWSCVGWMYRAWFDGEHDSKDVPCVVVHAPFYNRAPTKEEIGYATSKIFEDLFRKGYSVAVMPEYFENLPEDLR